VFLFIASQGCRSWEPSSGLGPTTTCFERL